MARLRLGWPNEGHAGHAIARHVLIVCVGALAVAFQTLALETSEARAAEQVSSKAPPKEDPSLLEARMAIRQKDYSRASELWRKAARRGNAEAQYRLGIAYRGGTGVKRDLAKAHHWLSKAVESGSADARYALGMMQLSGMGGPRDREKGMQHLQKAALAGHAGAKKQLARIGSSSSVAFASADSRVTANRLDPREALTQSIRTHDLGSAKESLARGAPINGAPGDKQHWRPLVLAIDRGDADMVDLLIRHGADPNVKSREGESALVLAIRSGKRPIVRALLKAKANLRASASSGYSVAMVAAQEGHQGIASDLIAAGADLKLLLDDGSSAATIARRFGHQDLYRMLVKRGAPARLGTDDANRMAALAPAVNRSGTASDDSMPPVIEAARRGDSKLLREMVDRRVKLDVQDTEGENALTRAAAEGHVDAVRILLGAGFAPDHPGHSGETALMRAMQSQAAGADEVFALLAASGANVHARNESGDAVFDFAAHGASRAKLDALSAAGASWTPIAAQTALAEASAAGRLSVVRALLALSSEKESGTPALCRAIERGHGEIVGYLLDQGVAAKGNCGSGRTPLADAIRHGDPALLIQLMAAGADPNESYRGGDPPLIVAASLGKTGMVEALIARGAEVDQRGTRERTALMAAASRGHAETTLALLKAGADRRMRSDTEQTAIALATQAEAQEVLEVFANYRSGWASWLGSGRD